MCTDATEWSPSVAANGNLYFGTTREGGKGRDDIWMSRLDGGRYTTPVNLGDSINTRFGEVEPWIAPDESYLIFSAGFRDPPDRRMSVEELTRRLRSPGNGLGDIYSIPIEALELPPRR